MKIELEQIGTIYTSFKTREGMPIQPKGANGVKGKIVINKELTSGLDDLMGFSHIILIYVFHKSRGFELKTKPFLDTKNRGVFSTRAPKRPNPIGISVVKLLEIQDNELYVQNIDVLNETPLLDIKPYIPEFDNYNVENIGWLGSKIEDLNDIKSDDRFI